MESCPGNVPAPTRTLPSLAVGITGLSGSGKSFLALSLKAMLEEHDIACVYLDADDLARDARKDPRVVEEIVQVLGPTVLNADGCTLDANAISSIIFDKTNVSKRMAYEAIFMSEVPRRIAACIMAAKAASVPDDIAHYLKDGLAIRKQCEAVVLLVDMWRIEEYLGVVFQDIDVVINVKAPITVRRERLLHRTGWTEAKVDRRIAAQSIFELPSRVDLTVFTSEGMDGSCGCEKESTILVAASADGRRKVADFIVARL